MAFGDNQIDGYAEGEEPMVFYHKKGNFRQYEDEKLSDLATGKGLPKRGFFRVLVGTKGNRFMLTAMLLAFVVVFFVSVFGGAPSDGTIGGLYCELSAFSFQESVYASLKVHPSAKGGALSEIRTEFIIVNTDGMESATDEQMFLYDEHGKKDQFVRTTFRDYDAVKVLCTIQSGDDTKTLTATVQQK